MKYTIVTVLVMMFTICGSNAQDITGQWHGLLKIPGNPLRLGLNIEKSNSTYTATLDSPDQGAMGIPVNTTLFQDAKLDIAITALSLTYTAELLDERLKGTFTQGGFSLPLEFSREPIAPPKRNRPQEPKAPYPYVSEEVSFENDAANLTLAGTLTLPKETLPNTGIKETVKYPVAVLISGSGPQNRNEELAGHKPFLVISDYLTRNGIAVLRFDDRGTGESTGDFKAATSMDFATDVESAVSYLKTRKDIDHNHIGLIGHSEGGIIAPIVASENNGIDYIVLMAGVGIRGNELLALQGKLIGKAAGQSDAEVERSAAVRQKMIDMAMASENIPALRNDLTHYLIRETENRNSQNLVPEGIDTHQYIKSQTDFMATPWMVYFLRHDPAKVLKKVTCPVLAINGSKDLQVPSKENLSAIGKALKEGGNTKVTLKELSGLNHLFQESETGSPIEYSTIEQTFSPIALEVISDWISDRLK